VGRTFSISSQRSDITDILSRKNDQGDTDDSGRKVSSSRKTKSSNQSQSHLPNIDENTINQLSPPDYYSNTPRSDSPITPRSSSPTSPRLPPSPTYSLGNKASRKSGNFNGLEVGPPVLPPLSFLGGNDDLSKLVVNEKDTEDRKKKHRSFIGEFPKDKSIKILSGVDSVDFEGFSSGSSPMSPNRKNSGSSITSLSSRENEIIIIEPEDTSVEELRKTLIDTKKKLAETERKMKVFII
jgi:hypothetical protein